MKEAVTITLDGVAVSGYTGMTVLELARESGVSIPTLCDDLNLSPTGACRLCLVEDEGSGALLASCVAPISPGMVINTRSARVLEHRKVILKLILASHPEACLICDKGNSCRLRQLAAGMGIGLIELERIPQPGIIEEVNPFIERDLSKCILCGKCIRADQEMVVQGAIDYIDRGAAARPATLGDTPLEKSECTFCGTCVAICPTGAIMEKQRAYGGTAAESVKTVCPYCGCGCTIHLNVKDGRVIRAVPATQSPVNRGTLCVSGSYGYDFIHSPERLTQPLIKENGQFHPASWDEALERVAAGLMKVKETSGPGALACFGSSKCTNEENYLLQRLARGVLGTNNIDNGSCLYSPASRNGLGVSIGYTGTTSSLEALERSQFILVIGADPDVSAPAVGYAVKRAVRYKGAELCSIDPRRTKLADFARLWLRPRVGADVALLNGMSKVILDEKRLDVEFVTRMTDNFIPWSRSLAQYTPEYVEEVTGVPRRDLQLAARLFAGAEEASIVYGNGIAQQPGATGAVMAIANLAMLTGNVDRRGGIFALQRENNAHGACDMGALPDFLPGYRSVADAAARRQFEQSWGGPLPESPGLGAPAALGRAARGNIKAMLIMGENPLASFPQPDEVRRALEGLEFLAVTDMFLTETARMATVVLPAASFAEKDGTFTNFEGRVQRVQRAVRPVGESLPDAEIILRLAEKLSAPLPYASLAQVTEEIESLVPFYRRSEGVEPENGDGDQPGSRRLHNGLFPSGFGRFTPVEYTPSPNGRDGYPLTLLTGSARYQFGAGARSRRSSRLGRLGNGASTEISPEDAKKYGIAEGDAIRISSPQGSLDVVARLSDALPPGSLFMPISCPDGSVYKLFAADADGQSGTPALKSCAVRLERVFDG